MQPKLIELGYQIMAISPDQPARVASITKGKKSDYTLLSDSHMKAAKAFGLAFKIDNPTYRRYQDYGIDLEEASGKKHHLLPVPAVFVLDQKGLIRFQYVNPDYRIRLDPDTLLAAAKAAAR